MESRRLVTYLWNDPRNRNRQPRRQ